MFVFGFSLKHFVHTHMFSYHHKIESIKVTPIPKQNSNNKEIAMAFAMFKNDWFLSIICYIGEYAIPQCPTKIYQSICNHKKYFINYIEIQ